MSEALQESVLEEKKLWHDNDQLWVHEFYHDGKREGERKAWRRNGELSLHEFYRDGYRVNLTRNE